MLAGAVAFQGVLEEISCAMEASFKGVDESEMTDGGEEDVVGCVAVADEAGESGGGGEGLPGVGVAALADADVAEDDGGLEGVVGAGGEEGALEGAADDAFAFFHALDHEEAEAGGGLDDGVGFGGEVGVEFFEGGFPEGGPGAEAEVEFAEVGGEVVFAAGAHDALPGNFPPAFGHASGFAAVEEGAEEGFVLGGVFRVVVDGGIRDDFLVEAGVGGAVVGRLGGFEAVAEVAGDEGVALE